MKQVSISVHPERLEFLKETLSGHAKVSHEPCQLLNQLVDINIEYEEKDTAMIILKAFHAGINYQLNNTPNYKHD